MIRLTEKYIIKQVAYWTKKLDLLPITIKTNNKIKYHGWIEHYKNNENTILTINIKSLIKNPLDLQGFIFHELGHIKYKTWKYNTTKDKIKSEIIAEKFALRSLKRYCPKQYIQYKTSWKKSIQDKKWQEKYPIYYKAFSRIYK